MFKVIFLVILSLPVHSQINPFLYNRKFRVVQKFGPYETKDGEKAFSNGVLVRSEKELDIISPGSGIVAFSTYENISPFLYVEKPFSLLVLHFENSTAIAIFNIDMEKNNYQVGDRILTGQVLGTTRDRHNLIKFVAIKSKAPYGKLYYGDFLNSIGSTELGNSYINTYYDPFELF